LNADAIPLRDVSQDSRQIKREIPKTTAGSGRACLGDTAPLDGEDPELAAIASAFSEDTTRSVLGLIVILSVLRHKLDACSQRADGTPNGIQQSYRCQQHKRLRSDAIIRTEIIEHEKDAAKDQQGDKDP
jgi:hypothetical protein